MLGTMAVENFSLPYGITQVVATLILVMMTIWLVNFRNGFAWTSNPDLQFNWHPLLMTVGMIILYANSILVYRAFRNSRKRKLKLAHTLIHGAAFVTTVIGLQAVFDFHNLTNKPNMYTLHSWIGLTSVILFACQWVSGFISFLFPMLSVPIRSAYLPVHVYFGVNGFVCAVAAALLGLLEKAIAALDWPVYSQLPAEGVLINCMGVMLVIYASLVVYLVTESSYKRQPIPEDEMLLTAQETTRDRKKK